jgi:Ca2+-binding EF-hand superfamily protein
MARFFKEQDIDEFRDCFYLHARSGNIRTLDELSVIMRSLGMSPTLTELRKYYKQKGGSLTFPEFLDVVHQHAGAENISQEILAAFRAYDVGKKGVISAGDLRHILQQWGEALSKRDVDMLFREAQIAPNGKVRYEDFVKIACAPIPDYK